MGDYKKRKYVNGVSTKERRNTKKEGKSAYKKIEMSKMKKFEGEIGEMEGS